MRFLFPAGAWALTALAAIAALYLLRRRSQSVTVPSLLLWQRAAAEQQAMKPFQKLKKNILLFLQLALALLLALALMRPAVSGGAQGETVLIFDLSASMQAEENGASRLETAKRRALALVDGMGEGDLFNVLTAVIRAEIVLSRSGDLTRVRSAIGALRVENGGADMDGAVSLAQAMARDIEGLNIIVFSDTYASPEVQTARVGSPRENRALLSLSVGTDGSAFVRVANYGGDAAVTLECSADGELCDMAALELAEGEIASAVLQCPPDAGIVQVKIAEPDALAADNVRWYAARQAEEYRAVLCGDNVFLEKAVSLRSDIRLLRAAAEEIDALKDIDLYIFDGALLDTLPERGALICVAPRSEALSIAPGETAEGGGSLRAETSPLARQLTENLLLEDIALCRYTPLRGGQAVLRLGEDALLSVAEREGRKAAVLGFDLHDSSLPMKGDFPVLMQNLLSWMLPDARQALPDGVCGQTVTLPGDSRAVSVQIILPSGRTVPAGETLEDTDEQGVYTLRFAYEGWPDRTARFVLHMESAESDLRQVGPSSDALSLGGRADAGRDLTPWVLLACFALLLAEWGVSRRVA